MIDWLSDLVEFLGPEEAGEWLTSPNAELDNTTPLQCVEDGEQDRIAEVVADL